MKLYSSPVAPSPKKVLVFISEKGIKDIEVKDLDIGKMEHKTDEYKKIAPNSRIPALVLDNGDVILETTAIYIAVVSKITSPLSNTNAGILEFGAIFLYSSVLCSIFPISRSLTSISFIPFSDIKTRTFLGLGATGLEYNFKFYSQLSAPPT